jgi:hypothetical protein
LEDGVQKGKTIPLKTGLKRGYMPLKADFFDFTITVSMLKRGYMPLKAITLDMMK